ADQPAPAPDPTVPPIACGVFDDHVVDGLPFRRRPEERTFEKVAILLADNAISVLRRPLLQNRVGPTEMPREGKGDRHQDGRDEEEAFHTHPPQTARSRLAKIGHALSMFSCIHSPLTFLRPPPPLGSPSPAPRP